MFYRVLRAFAGYLSVGAFWSFSLVRYYYFLIRIEKREKRKRNREKREREGFGVRREKRKFLKFKQPILLPLQATIYRVRVRNSVMLLLCMIMYACI